MLTYLPAHPLNLHCPLRLGPRLYLLPLEWSTTRHELVPSKTRRGAKAWAVILEFATDICRTSVPSEHVARATAKSSTKRVASTEQDSEIRPRKRVKNGSEQSCAMAGIPEDLDLQCASYALELLWHGGLRNHVIAVTITDRKNRALILRPLYHCQIFSH